MQLRITTNAIDARYFFNRLTRDQLPFAISRAINHLAYQARDDEQSLLGYYFDLRTGWLKKKGAMPVIASRKAQHPDIHAILGVSDEIAALSATGGKRRPNLGGKLAVPLSDAGSGQSARELLNPGNQTLGPRFFPSRIVRGRVVGKGRRAGGKPRPFVIGGKDGQAFVVQRNGSDPLQFLYALKSQVEVKESWPLVAHVGLHVGRNYAGVLQRELAAAVASAKR